MVALEEPFSLEAAYKLLVLVITDLAMDTVSVMDTDTDMVIMVMDLVTDLDTDLDMDSVMDTITTPGHRPNGMEMSLLTLQMMNTPTLSLSM